MKHQEFCLAKSSYYTPAFNCAIFDGPVRIYFSQCQESTALTTYFMLRDTKTLWISGLKTWLNQNGSQIYLLIYPTAETFNLSLETTASGAQNIVERRVGNDTILAIPGWSQDFQTALNSKLLALYENFILPEGDLEPATAQVSLI